jgi:hypothetical protein
MKEDFKKEEEMKKEKKNKVNRTHPRFSNN